MSEIIIPKKYMFAVEGQIYETDNILGIKADIDAEQYLQLVRDTVFQIAFLEALKKTLPHLASVKGLHPNLKNVAKFDESDEFRLNCLKETINLLDDHDPVILQEYNVDDLTSKAVGKMLETISDIPNAWTDDGKLKPEFIDKYRSDILNVDDL